MEATDSVMLIKNYGKVKLKLREYLDERQMSRNALARAVNTRFEVIDKWYNNAVEKIDLDVLARICFVLSCRVEDIVEYEEK